MSDRWLYKPEICDGRPCVGDCDKCDAREDVLEEEEDETDRCGCADKADREKHL